ncbi:hypothetical protein SESBI_05649 [Sesbania bispinosa]|nr:hypothetical protein SESBI_05649 [Sesbania bispinosa]
MAGINIGSKSDGVMWIGRQISESGKATDSHPRQRPFPKKTQVSNEVLDMLASLSMNKTDLPKPKETRPTTSTEKGSEKREQLPNTSRSPIKKIYKLTQETACWARWILSMLILMMTARKIYPVGMILYLPLNALPIQLSTRTELGKE